MRYIRIVYKNINGNVRLLAHEFDNDNWTTAKVAATLSSDLKHLPFVFEAITKEQYDKYFRRGLTTKHLYL